MVDVAQVKMFGKTVGSVRWNTRYGVARFEYDGEVRSGQVDAQAGFDYYLIKLDGVSATAGFKETENFGRLEYSFAKLVRACGINMTECHAYYRRSVRRLCRLA